MQRKDIGLWIQTATAFITISFLGLFFANNWGGVVVLLETLRDAILNLPRQGDQFITYYSALSGDVLLPSLGFGAVVGAILTGFFIWQRGEKSLERLLMSGLVGLGAGLIGSQLLLYPTQHCTYAADAPRSQFWIGIGLTVVGVLIMLLPAWTWLGRGGSLREGESSAGFFRNRWAAYTLLLPSLTVLTVFLYYPASQILTLSLKAKRFPLPQERFVCLQNYTTLASDTPYQNSFLATMLITIAVVALTMTLALGIAVLASQKIRGASIYRTLLIWPFALSPVVTGVIFLAMFREGDSGLINYGLTQTLGISPRWLTDANLAPWVIILSSVWNALGFNILFYIAGLQNVPQDLLEAAAIDGANVVQRFGRITIPLLSPFTFFLLVTNITYAFYGIYGAVDTITQGGPPLGPGGADGGATSVLIYKLYGDAFGAAAPIGQAAAQSLILFLMVAGITVLQFRFVENRVTYSA